MKDRPIDKDDKTGKELGREGERERIFTGGDDSMREKGVIHELNDGRRERNVQRRQEPTKGTPGSG